jgi:hypothetical protein
MLEPHAADCDPALARLFVPARPRLGSYEVCATSDLLGLALSRDGFRTAEPQLLEVLDVLGTAGTFDRARVVQLYGGRRVAVRRGWRIADGRFESMTEMSPYPDASLTALHEGSLIIRWTANLGGPRSPERVTASRR